MNAKRIEVTPSFVNVAAARDLPPGSRAWLADGTAARPCRCSVRGSIAA